jgi:very-short-patch-repair endonuclease
MSRRGIHLHRCPSLHDPPSSPPSLAIRGGRGRGITSHRHNIPVTSIQRTIDDLEGTVAPYLLRRARRQAELKGIHLQGVERRRQRSDLEEDFLALFLAHRFPHPETNVKLGRHEVDFLWRSQRLVVEADSFAYHGGSVSFHADHARDLDLRQRGYSVLRFDEQQLEEEPERIAAVVREALS